MGGGGGDTVTNTGLGDDQYQALADNQVGISGQITDARDDASARYDTFDNRFDGLDTSVAGVGSNLTAGFTNLQDLMDQYNQGMNTQFDTVNTGVGNNATALSNNATSIGNLQTDVTGGFNDMGGRFDTLDTGQANIQGAVDQGFTDQAQGFADAQADRTAQFDAANTAMTAGFGDTGEALAEGFGDASTQLTNTQSNLQDGQGQLQDNLDAFSGRADAYATSQLENQANMQSNQEGFQSSFDSFTERYGDDTELAQQSRADLATAQSNQTDRLREDMGTFAQAAATGQQALGTQLEGVATGMDTQLSQLGGTVESGFVDTQNAALNAANTTNAAIDAQAQATANQAANTEASIANSITQMGDQSANILSKMDAGQVTAARDMAKLAAGQEGLDANMRADFEQMGSAFDDNGSLIKNSIDAQGNTITRAMDQQGNMLLKKFNVQGQETGSSLINIGQRLQQLQPKPNAGNTQMGTTTPQAQVGGFASSPYQQTGTLGMAQQIKPSMERPPNPFAGTIPVSQPIDPNTFTR